MNPFLEHDNESADLNLVKKAMNGSKEALELLIQKHQLFIYNLALRLVKNSDDAADLTQEVLIKVFTKLSQFEGKSSLRTWLYRITVNHFLSYKRTKSEKEVYSFDEYGKFIGGKYNDEDFTTEEMAEHQEQVIEVRNRCLTSMLLCLDREQRIVFILGAIFNIKSTVAARILEITADNFRQQLSRAKKDLFQFMDDKCGLINPLNPCRCSKKTKGFMKEGIVDKSSKIFKSTIVQTVQSQVNSKNEELTDLIEGKYLVFFHQQPYEDCNVGEQLVRSLLLDPQIVKLFHLN